MKVSYNHYHSYPSIFCVNACILSSPPAFVPTVLDSQSPLTIISNLDESIGNDFLGSLCSSPPIVLTSPSPEAQPKSPPHHSPASLAQSTLEHSPGHRSIPTQEPSQNLQQNSPGHRSAPTQEQNQNLQQNSPGHCSVPTQEKSQNLLQNSPGHRFAPTQEQIQNLHQNSPGHRSAPNQEQNQNLQQNSQGHGKQLSTGAQPMSPGTKSKLPNPPGVRIRPKSPSSNNPGTHQENPPKRFRRALLKDHPSSPQLDNLFALWSVDKDVTHKRSRSGQGQGKFKGLIVDANFYHNCIANLSADKDDANICIGCKGHYKEEEAEMWIGCDVKENHWWHYRCAGYCRKPSAKTVFCCSLCKTSESNNTSEPTVFQDISYIATGQMKRAKKN